MPAIGKSSTPSGGAGRDHQAHQRAEAEGIAQASDLSDQGRGCPALDRPRDGRRPRRLAHRGCRHQEVDVRSLRRVAEAPGLYAGNHVEILGIPVGTITSVKAEPEYVLITMDVSGRLKVPQAAFAVIMAPQVVADRFVQLGPGYTGGPTLANHAVIPLTRTVIPQSVDAVIASLTQLAEQLGPNGANKTGALTDLVHQLSVQFSRLRPRLPQRGDQVQRTALDGLAQNSPAFAGTLTNLGGLSQALANDSGLHRVRGQPRFGQPGAGRRPPDRHLGRVVGAAAAAART